MESRAGNVGIVYGERKKKMSKIEEFAKLIGVKLNVPFKVQGFGIYRLTEKGLQYKWNGCNEWAEATLPLNIILTDKIKIIPFALYDGVTYYYTSYDASGGNVMKRAWSECTLDYALSALGMIYASEEECKANKEKDYKKLKGEE